jgi:hypothetical protein
MYETTDTMVAASATPSKICNFRKSRPLVFHRHVAQTSVFEYRAPVVRINDRVPLVGQWRRVFQM